MRGRIRHFNSGAHHQFLWTPGQLVQKYAAMLEDKSSWSLPEKEAV